MTNPSGVGGTLAKYASEGVDVFLLTATRGDGGRFHDYRPNEPAPPAPIGILGDFLAAAANPNVGAWTLSPTATEIECQAVRWIAEFIGYPAERGGLLVSGGNMANFVCFFAAGATKAGWNCPAGADRDKYLLPILHAPAARRSDASD